MWGQSVTPSVWINNIVAVESTDRGAPSVWIKQHWVEADWLPIQVSIEWDFLILVGGGHLISCLGKVRCYKLLGSTHWTPSYFMIGYSQVHFKVRHTDVYIYKQDIYLFRVLCPYSLVLVRRSYILTTNITETEPGAEDPWTLQN